MGDGAGQGERVSHRVPSWVWWAATGLAIAYLAWENFPTLGHGNARDWRFFYPAAEALVRGTDLYESGEGGYVYPPLLAFLVTPLVPLGFFPSAQVWLGLSLAALVAALALTAGEVSRRVGEGGGWRAPRLGTSVLLGLLLSANVARRELEHTQTDWITVMGFVLGLLWMDRRPVLAGAALGLAANVKYHTLIVVPYLLVRGRLKA
ncbi:MAG: glycosyltransferase 87 family protein, partial [Gemmatimonadales bacterium]